MRLLLARGAASDPQALGASLTYAEFKGHTEIVRLLREAGATDTEA